jgi:hypothetical protein
MKKRVKSHILEKVISFIMMLFGIAAIWIFAVAAKGGINSVDLAIIEILLIIVLAILAQTVILIRIYEKEYE